MLEGVRLYGGNGMGVDLHCADALIGVSPYCSVWSLYHSIEIYRKMIAQPGTSEGVYRTDLRLLFKVPQCRSLLTTPIQNTRQALHRLFISLTHNTKARLADHT